MGLVFLVRMGHQGWTECLDLKEKGVCLVKTWKVHLVEPGFLETVEKGENKENLDAVDDLGQLVKKENQDQLDLEESQQKVLKVSQEQLDPWVCKVGMVNQVNVVHPDKMEIRELKENLGNLVFLDFKEWMVKREMLDQWVKWALKVLPVIKANLVHQDFKVFKECLEL